MLNFFALITLFAPLLPWMSYGVGSKTGIDIGGKATYIIFMSSICLIIFNFIIFKTEVLRKSFLLLAFLASATLFTLYAYEIIKIAYQTTIAKNLPVEMFGVVSLSAKEIRIGYGLWVGGIAAILSTIINFIFMRIKT
jgi:hypothetical protein